MSLDTSDNNAFLTAPLGAIFARTALPIIFVMSMNGLLTIVDAMMLGLYVGPEAVGAVASVFPVFMLLVALSTLVGSGMASLLARSIGAGDFVNARAVFGSAHGLALAIGAGFVVLFLLFGRALVLAVANGPGPLAEMAYAYITIIALFCPLQLLLSVNVDALRCEGRAGLMALLSLFVSLANLGLNYVFIASLGLGVAGSAFATVLAQGLALGLLVFFRLSGRTVLPLAALLRGNPFSAWGSIVALGAPQSLGFIGMALVSATIIVTLQSVATQTYDTVISAYGIVTRIMTFAFLPLLGMGQAMQAIVGNNRGAGLWQRSDRALRLAVIVSFLYCLAVEILLAFFARPIGSFFVNDRTIIGDVSRIMPLMVMAYFLSGPLMMTASYFQAIGDARHAAILGLAKPYLFTIPLVVLFAIAFGERGIWFATPAAEVLLFAVTGVVLWQAARQKSLGRGLVSREIASER
ncbi:MATE family efflux transporter [Pararhizobium sp. PWRC1-1]|uniref:MATE family efflux transporter n=1 Tax=Pararhizobium sp. PWRC1-1 TaxID=2804566 RepID=UPI003CF1BAF4